MTNLKISMANIKIEEIKKNKGERKYRRWQTSHYQPYIPPTKKWCCGFSNNSFEYYIKYFIYNVFQLKAKKKNWSKK